MSSEKMKYSSIGKTVDGTTYCSAVETLAENIIEDNEADATIVFPSATGWASVRSTSYRMTSDNAEAVLPLPIYKINKVLIKVAEFSLSWSFGGAQTTRKISDFKDEYGNSFPTEWDISNLVVTVEEWKALSLATSLNDYSKNIRKDNTFYWEKEASTIPILSKVYKIGSFPIDAFNDNTPTYERLVRYVLTAKANDYTSNAGTLENVLENGTIKDLDPRQWQFRIEYVPVSSKTKIRARKNAPTKEEYIQPFNQRAEINAASAFGKNMYLTAQKTGCKEITVVKNYTKWSDVPPLGALVRHKGRRYRLVANHYVQTNTVYVQVTHTLSENWSEKSKHVAVDQKYRNWNIPQDTLWRNLYWEDYLRVGTSRKTGKDEAGGVDVHDVTGLFEFIGGKCVDTFCWITEEDIGKIADTGKIIGATVPCSTYGIANSLIFSATFKDNLSAGLRATKWGTDGEYLCEEALYCKADGTLDKARVILSEGGGVTASFEIDENMSLDQAASIAAFEETKSVFYPSIVAATGTGTTDNKEYTITANAPLNPVFDKEFYIYKDPGEAIKFTYQIHLIGEDDCFFGNKFAEHNTLVKNWGLTERNLRVWLLKHYIREGADVLETTSGDLEYPHLPGNNLSIYELSSEDGCRILTLTKDSVCNFLASGEYLAWAITDENKNLYVACNDASKTELYFQLHHKR